MFFPQQQLPVSWAGVCVALTGALFCILQTAAAPGAIPCPGTGCHLFQDFTLYGISLWWAGVAYFAFMVLVCLRRAKMFALAVASLALAADGVLLAIMLLTASCVACLGAAAFIGLLFLALRRHIYSRTVTNPKPPVLFIVWAGLFIAATVNAGTEQLPSWQLHGPENAERRIYFSPSCPACRDAVTVFAGSAAFIPVAERDSDYAAIYRMRQALAAGETLVDALAAADNGTAEEPWTAETALYRLMLLRNKAEVLRLGFDRLPLILINGMPRSLRPERETGASGTGRAPEQSTASADLPPELTIIDSCGESREPCETPR